ncbi:hypothetical protein SNE40_022195 [Patella caerulea]|uniref:Uncharacterized protein n=1 Tax=Patella caerulea TaxID=87958 RepID=A0AAN8FVX2_PATCE
MDDTEDMFDVIQYNEDIFAALEHSDDAIRLEAVKRCINKNPDWNEMYLIDECDDANPLMSAARSGFHECLSVMLEAGADVRDCDRSLDTALHYCFLEPENKNSANRLKCVRLLLDAGADVYHTDMYDGNPLMAACYICDLDCLKEILKRGYERKNNQNRTENHKSEKEVAARFFVDSSNTVYVETAEGVGEVTTNPSSSLDKESEPSNQIDRMDINLPDRMSYRNAFHHCLSSENTGADQIACLRLLLDAGADPTIKPGSSRSMEIAITSSPNSLSLVKLLLAAGVPFDVPEDIRVALTVPNVELVEFYLKRGANVNHRYEDGFTVLTHLMAGIPKGFPRNIDRDERTNACLKILLNAKADINLSDSKGRQPIHFALSRWSFLKFPTEYLISENCDFSKLPVFSALVLRARGKEEYLLDMVNFLYECGLSYSLCQSLGAASPYVKNCFGKLTCSPRRLVSLSVFAIRQHIGVNIKAKCGELEIPKIVKNLILLKDVLSPECF